MMRSEADDLPIQGRKRASMITVDSFSREDIVGSSTKNEEILAEIRSVNDEHDKLRQELADNMKVAAPQ